MNQRSQLVCTLVMILGALHETERSMRGSVPRGVDKRCLSVLWLMFEIGVRPSASGNTEVIMHRFFRPDP
jgi:hypothetical protein